MTEVEIGLHFGLPANYRPGKVIRTDEGWWIDPNDTQFGKWVIEHKDIEHDPAFVKWCADWIKAGTIVIDVGANIGTHSVPYLEREPRHLVAVEPSLTSFECLRRNVLLGLSRFYSESDVWCYCCAAGDDFDLLPFGIDPETPGMSHVARDVREKTAWQTVQISPLDILVEPCRGGRVSFLKIDAEGYEPFVIVGAKQILHPSLGVRRPVIVMEINNLALGRNQWTGEKLFELMGAIRYRPMGKWPPEFDKLSDKELFEQPQFDACFTPI